MTDTDLIPFTKGNLPWPQQRQSLLAAGLLLAEFVADGRTQLDLSAFSPDRFAPGVVAEYLATTVAQEAAVRRRH